MANNGGPWGGGNDGGPWGNGNNGNNNDKNTPPNVEDIFKNSQIKFKNNIPGGGNIGFGILAAIVLFVWLISGFYQVKPEEQGVVLRFGKFTYTTMPGLHYHLPYPIEEVITPNVTNDNRIEIGFREYRSNRDNKSTRDVIEESLMLTGDENIVDVNYTVTWNIKDAGKYLFNMRDPDGTVRVAAESAMREVVGQTDIQRIITGEREKVEEQTMTILQNMMDEFESGVNIRRVKLLKADPPKQVVDAFNEVQRAKADKERYRNEAEAYSNDILPKARGEAKKRIQDAEAYKEKVINKAEGDAARFLSVYNEYKQAKEVTAKRLYLETMEDVLSRSNKVIIDKSKTGGVLPYLPLEGLNNQKGAK